MGAALTGNASDAGKLMLTIGGALVAVSIPAAIQAIGAIGKKTGLENQARAIKDNIDLGMYDNTVSTEGKSR